ncbi:nuclease-related domain-containing DEAD/DEAH box helicase [Tengunoibacter tsumagoiensis]|uniref:Nuclease n=1 Tax=Tengunoibacter tsumagoiensis TaxID=2014871 RepID=A0A402A068_9CHLR|nr:NERD domain-containing protein [Tengunoibacter tsumagoiensis]GCE12503.1 nuclease [Tengunoibacter tsumagoiensis]
MARMIPPTYHINTSSKGEVEVFRRLRDDPKTQNWIVLHSLDVANHQKQISGEIDFVVIIPNRGVLCIEVKACHRLKRHEGQWYYGNNSTPDTRGPFKQASQAMHSTRLKIFSRNKALSGILFWSAVIFPYVTFSAQSEEWHSWQVIDRTQFNARPLGVLLERILDEAHHFIKTKEKSIWHPSPDEPTQAQSEQIAELLRPSFEFFESPKSRRQRQSEELKYYTTEQFSALDSMEMNPRIIFSGPAGTGKTLLAIEAARRSNETGKKVLFLCYNNLLGKWLAEQTTELQPNVTTKTLHSHMLAITKYTGSQSSHTFWQQDLPSLAIDKLLEAEGEEGAFDEIIVDEAQDILQEKYLDFLDLSLRGGLASGHWKLFGDFEKQAIYDVADFSLDTFLRERTHAAPTYKLNANCRNTPRIVQFVHLLGNLHPGYSKILRSDNKMEPVLRYYTNLADQQHLLTQILEQLYAEGLTDNDIVILSPRSTNSCLAGSLDKSPWKDRLSPLSLANRGKIGYSSIQGFKGLESEVVIVTDIEMIDSDASSALFYIAATRALNRLFILMNEGVQQSIRKKLHFTA